MSDAVELRIAVTFDDVATKLAQNPEFDQPGFQQAMAVEFADETPIEVMVKNGPVYLRRSRTQDSGYKLEAFDSPDFEGAQMLGFSVLELSGKGRTCVEDVGVRKDNRRRGIDSAFRQLFSEKVSAFGGRLCRSLREREILPDGRASVESREPVSSAVRDLYFEMLKVRTVENLNPSRDVTPQDEHLWSAFSDLRQS